MRHDEVSDGVRLRWACVVRNVYQVIVGEAVDGDPTCVEAIVDRLTHEMAPPINSAESLMVRQSLAMLTQGIGQTLHRCFHIRFVRDSCTLRPGCESEDRWLNSDSSIAELLNQWRADYLDWFDAHHRLPPALRLKHTLQQQFANTVPLYELARAAGTSRSRLIEQFTDAFGLPPSEYRLRLRVREGLRRLRTSDDSVDRAARQVGYQSGSKFSKQVQRSTGLTPSDVRMLDDDTFYQLLEERVTLRPVRIEERHLMLSASIAHAADRRRHERRAAERRALDGERRRA